MKGLPSSADVVMLGTFSAWNLGTLQARALPMAHALKTHGVNVAVVTTPWDQPSEAGVIDAIDGVPLINTCSTSTTLPLPAVREQLAWIRRLRPSAVHVMKPRGFGGLAARLLPGSVPLVIDSDDWEGNGGWNDSGKYTWTQQRIFHAQEHDLLKRADIVTAASTLLAHRAALLRGSGEQVHLVANGINRQRLNELMAARSNPPSKVDPPVVVLYSRFEEFPSDWLSRFVSELAGRTTRNVLVRVIGRDRAPLDPPVRAGSVNVEFMGYVALSQVPELLGSATVAVFPYQDSLITRAKQSVKLLELMAAGCPVIASDVGDVAGVLDVAGIARPGVEPSMFAEEAASLMNQPDELDAMSATAQARAHDAYRIDVVSKPLIDAYRATGLW